MEDQQIIELYWNRNEAAITETSNKYGHYCTTISYRIVESIEDAEECVNEMLLRVWNRIPPTRPSVFPPFLAKIVRHISIDTFRRKNADRRGGGVYPLALEEIRECCGESAEDRCSAKELAEAVNAFLRGLPDRERGLFIDRYFYFRSVEDAAKHRGVAAKHASVILFRTRKKLHDYLEKEGLL